MTITPLEILSLIQDLTEEQLNRLKQFILSKLCIATAIATADTAKHTCPHCESVHVIKKGHKNGKQRYFCKDCGKYFNETVGTVAYKSKYGYETWSQYVDCMLFGRTLRDTAEIVGIHYKTAFYWRHKVMGSLSEVLENRLALSGVVEADETFFPLSYKGNHKFSKTFKMPRKPHKRGQSVKKRGLSKEQVCVACMTDGETNYQADIAGLGRIATRQLEALNHLASGSTLVTDKCSAYRKYAQMHGFDLVQLKAGKEYKRGSFTLAHINSFHTGLKRFVRGFVGVSTKHLPNYLHWKIWLLKAVRLVQSMRGTNMLQEAIQHTFFITKEQIHAKNPIPVAA